MAKNAKKILIAEDEKPMSKALEIKLGREGYDIKVAYNGEEAIDYLKKEKFDLVLLDLIMPKKDGFDVLTEIRDKKIKTSVIVLSNLGQEEDMNRAKALGAKDFFIKSATPIAEILGHIQKML